MKQTLYSVCIASLALAVTAWGAQDNQSFSNAKKGRRAATVQSNTAAKTSSRAMISSGRVRTQSNFQAARFHPRTYRMTAQNNSNAVVHRNALRSSRIHTSQALSARSSNNQSFRTRRALAVNRENNNVKFSQTTKVNRERNFNVNRGQNFNRRRDVTVVNNWRGERFRGQNYAAFRNYHREFHDRDWWHRHHNRIVFVFGAPYYWDTGYWYPAWGYYPSAYYPYDGPIYGYSDLTPDQVTVNVQAQLQRDGYYAGPIDGLLGPETRRAIAAFQADHGLAVTAAIDEPTLETLGLT
jgi:hypothetical protein